MATAWIFGSSRISRSSVAAQSKPNFRAACRAVTPEAVQTPASRMPPAFFMAGRRTDVANIPAPRSPTDISPAAGEGRPTAVPRLTFRVNAADAG
jgi:hypothetical protein